MEEKEMAFISMPMAGKEGEEIKQEWERHAGYLNTLNYDVLQTYIGQEYKKISVSNARYEDRTACYFLAQSLSKLSMADIAYFAKGWERSRGCLIEHLVCEFYNIPRFYEE